MNDDVSKSTEELILRDHLALDRTRLANERTLLSYLRTALMLIVAGATAERFVSDDSLLVITGWAFIVLGIGMSVLRIWRFIATRRSINQRRKSDPAG